MAFACKRCDDTGLGVRVASVVAMDRRAAMSMRRSWGAVPGLQSLRQG